MNKRLIFKIAGTELATLFYSPIAWFLLVAFAVQVGLDFGNIITEIVRIKVLRGSITFSATAGVVLGGQGIFEVIQKTIYLYIPLLTMNLMSREYASGSIKLLYSSPLNSTHIITGKFLSMVVFSLLFVAVLALPVVAMAITIPGMDITLVLAGLLSMLLLILTYCSIGLFMSTLTSYQVVSAVATLSALAFLNHVGEIELALNRKDYVANTQFDADFHMRCVEASGNQYLMNIYQLIMGHVPKSYYLNTQNEPFARQSLEDHRMILDAIREGSPTKAQQRVKKHTARIIKAIREKRA